MKLKRLKVDQPFVFYCERKNELIVVMYRVLGFGVLIGKKSKLKLNTMRQLQHEIAFNFIPIGYL